MISLIQNSKFKIQNLRKGFTLIELLIVIAIIGILSTVLMVNFIGIRERARDARRKSDLRQIQQAIELYKADAGSYPAQNILDGNCGSALKSTDGNTTYMSKVPGDPGSFGCYHYLNPGESGAPYTLWACLENTNDNDSHSSISNSQCGQNLKTFKISSDQ